MDDLCFTVRAATPEDAPAIAAIHIAAWQHAYAGLIHKTFLDSLSAEHDQRAEMWRGYITRHAGAVSFALAGEQPAGFASVRPSSDAAFPDYAELGTLYLAPCYIGCGIGRALLAAAQRFVLERGYSALFTEVLSDNSTARAFYERTNATLIPDSEKPFPLDGHSYLTVKYAWKLGD